VSRFSRQVLIMVLLIVFSIFFGVDLATRGVERIHGPAAGTAVQQGLPGSDARALRQEAPKPKSSVPHKVSAVSGDTLINRIANKTGDLLQIIAYHGIQWIVSFFSGLMR